MTSCLMEYHISGIQCIGKLFELNLHFNKTCQWQIWVFMFDKEADSRCGQHNKKAYEGPFFSKPHQLNPNSLRLSERTWQRSVSFLVSHLFFISSRSYCLDGNCSAIMPKWFNLVIVKIQHWHQCLLSSTFFKKTIKNRQCWIILNVRFLMDGISWYSGQLMSSLLT